MSDPDRGLGHLAEDGEPCTQHPPAGLDAILSYASVGARVPSFNHDIASKLQGMMMAIDELDELIERRGDAELRSALDTASAAMKELNRLLSNNRALTRGGKATRTTLRELVRQAAERSGVQLQGEIVDAPIDCALPLLAHAVSLVIEVASGVQRNRTLDVATRCEDGFAEIALTCASTVAPTASELLALANHGIARERGSLRCGDARLTVRLPSAS